MAPRTERRAGIPASGHYPTKPTVKLAARSATSGTNRDRWLPRRAVAAPELFRLSPRDVVPDTRTLLTAVEAGGGLEQRAVIGGDALVLAEVLDPGLDDEHLEPPVRVLGVAVDAPADGAVAAADRLQPPHGAQELLGLVGVHVVLERDEHGALVAVELGGGLRQRPARGGAEGEGREGLQRERARGGGAGEAHRRDREERRGDVRVRRDHAPEEAAHRHAALEGQEAHGERPCPHPRRHGVLGGDAERGHGAHPRHAADEEPAARDARHARKRDDGGHGGEDGRAREDETVAGEALADAWQEGRAHDRARAEAPEEEPVARRRELESPAREERE